MSFRRPWIIALLLSSLLTSFPGCHADQYITFTESNNEVVSLHDDRQPALYTEAFGSCLPNSQTAITIDRFDTAVYRDNMTVVFHIAGSTQLASDNVMIYLEVYAYGESRFELTWNPCGTEVTSLCPVKSSVPIQASGMIPLTQQDVENIPHIAFNFLDVEGQVVLRIFSNTDQTEIACYAAALSNGGTFNHQDSVGVVLGIFALVAIVSSLATAVYGQSIPEMRTHYAHSVSVLVVFSVFHHIYFTGALSMNWPGVLVAFWANYAWAAGMISIPSMQKSISKFTGNLGNTMEVGAARTGGDSSNVAGGFDIHKIYRRYEEGMRLLGRSAQPGKWMNSVDALSRRDLPSTATGFKWYGPQVGAGLPLPGNFSGFAGTLSEEMIPASNAFLTGLVWFLILLVTVAASIAFLKVILEIITRRNGTNMERFEFFRTHWKRYVIFALLRGCYISFFMIMFLTIFQFTYNGRPGVLSIAAVTFAILLVGMLGVAGFACHTRLRNSTWTLKSDRIVFKKVTMFGILPCYIPCFRHEVAESDNTLGFSVPCSRIHYSPSPNRNPVYEDDEYILLFGWLISRFRQSRWWFSVVWLLYELARACFLAGASGHPLVQVFCLLALEFIAFIFIATLRPFEGQRLNIVMVYLLGFSKVVTVALSSAFDVTFNIDRTAATIVGITIIAIQLLLTIALMVCIILGAISTYFSTTRNREVIKPKSFMPWREKYLEHITQAATDQRPKTTSTAGLELESSRPANLGFSVKAVKRLAKIEDEDQEFQRDIMTDPRSPNDHNSSELSLVSAGYLTVPGATADGKRMSRRLSVANSLSSNMSHSSLPYAAVLHRGSWTTREFAELQAERDPLADRVRHEEYILSENGERALSPRLQHLSSRDSLTDFSRLASREPSWNLKPPSSRGFTSAPREMDVPETQSNTSNSLSEPVESTASLTTLARAKSPLLNTNAVESTPQPSSKPPTKD